LRAGGAGAERPGRTGPRILPARLG